MVKTLKGLEDKLTARIPKAQQHSITTRENFTGFAENYEKNRVKDIYAFAEQVERADNQSDLSKASSVLITGIIALLDSSRVSA